MGSIERNDGAVTRGGRCGAAERKTASLENLPKTMSVMDVSFLTERPVVARATAQFTISRARVELRDCGASTKAIGCVSS